MPLTFTLDGSLWGDMPSWVLAVVGIGAAWIALRTLNAIKEQGRDTSTSVNAARQGAEAALLSAQALVNSERAWIDADLIQRPSQPTVYDLKIMNYGKTPAQILRCETAMDSVASPSKVSSVPALFDPGKMSGRTTRNIDKLIGGGNGWHPDGLWYDISKDLPDWSGIQNGTKSGLIHITVKYFDIVTIGAEPRPRETSFLYCYLPIYSRLDRVPFYNKYT